MDDRKIVDLYWARSEQAICETQLKYGRYCLSIASNILPFREDAEESVNDTYLTAWNIMPPERPGILSTFLGKLTRRISIDRWRKLSADKRGGGCVPLALDELSGEHVDACSLSENKLICWSSTDNAYISNYFKIWNFDLRTFERTDLFDGMRDAAESKAEDAGIVFLEGFDGRSHWGNNYTGSPFALARDEEQNTYLIDLASGERSDLAGIVWQPGMSRNPSSDGTKLLLTSRREGELDIGSVAVVDYERKTVLQFYRENPNQILESMAYWFDEDTIVVCSEVYASSLCTDYYFYNLFAD